MNVNEGKMMKHLSWHDQLVIATDTHNMYGVKVSFDDFNIMTPEGDAKWAAFVDEVFKVFTQADASNIMSSIINGNLMLFDELEEAKRLIMVLTQSQFNDVYFTYTTPQPTIDFDWSLIIGKNGVKHDQA